jgi:hypothetical protein
MKGRPSLAFRITEDDAHPCGGPARDAAQQPPLATRIGFAVDGWYLIIGSLVRGYTG